MDKYKHYYKQPFPRSTTNSNMLLKSFILISVIWALLACAEKKMSVEEAKRVTVAMAKESFVPPPRRINDISSILEEPGNFHIWAVASG